ncbi:MAG: transporter related [Thermoanaerobacter sp.]|jgi:ribose transport system ATP-binding protein|nr:transporter related [Thermoanaerobacter sp.]
MVGDIILEMKNISKFFPGVKALNNVNLVLREGQVHALVGENGAGKSTLMKILSGIYIPDEGNIIYEGEEVIFRTPNDAKDKKISIIHQELNLCNNLSVADNIFAGKEFLKNKLQFLDKKKINQEAKKLLDYLEVDIKPDEFVGSLSISKKQMVEIAKAMAENARILIMDEPTSALTEKETDVLFKLISNLKSKGVSIVYISHRMEEIIKIADCVSVLRDGNYIGSMDIKDVTIPKIISMMVGRTLDDIFPRRNPSISNVVLEVKNLKKKGLIKDISFNVRKGEILGIAGLVGAGRTELAKILFGAIKKDSGEVKIENKTLEISSPIDAINGGIALITENRKEEGLCLELSVKENMFSASMDKVCNFAGFINNKLVKSKALNYIDILKIKTPTIDQIIKNLSGGNQQKVIIAKWLETDSKVLILDEPTRGIDVGAKYEIYTLMNKLTSDGVAIIMISSELPEILGMSDRVIVMRQGEITAEFPINEATQENIMYYAAGGNKVEC